MNKFGFIKQLLDHEKFDASQKERFLKLVSSELVTMEGNDVKNSEQIKVLMKGLNLEDDFSINEGDLNNNDGLISFLSKEEQDNLFDESKFEFEENEDIKKEVKESKKTTLGQLLEQFEVESDDEFKNQIREDLLKEGIIDKDLSAKQVSIAKSKTLHKPLETKNFLSLFNNSDSLKFLTHRFNDGKRDYDEFLCSCKSEFAMAINQYGNVPFALIRRIEEFTFSEKPEWFIRKGNQIISPGKGWSEKSFIEWYKKGINSHPSSDSKWNKEMIVPFKNTIEVKAGSLPVIIQEAINLSFGNSLNNFSIFPKELNESTLTEAEFYTDVDKLQNALFLIFSTIKEFADKNLCFEIKISFENETIKGGKFKKLIITHVDSNPIKQSSDPAFAKGDLKSIQLNLWGLCNYEITGKFPDGYRKRVFLTDDIGEYKDYVEPKKSIFIDSENVDGFSHVLKFY